MLMWEYFTDRGNWQNARPIRNWDVVVEWQQKQAQQS